jgi:hypothetical protein
VSLPFEATGSVENRSGDQLAVDVPMTIWPENGYPVGGGQRYDHTGHLDPTDDAKDALIGKGNRVIVSAGVRYNVVGAVLHAYTSLLEVNLAVVKPDG